MRNPLATLGKVAGADIVVSSSLKAALDLDWDDLQAKAQALTTILQALNNVESWVEQQTNLDAQTTTEVKKSLDNGRLVEAQDVEVSILARISWSAVNADLSTPTSFR